MVASILSSYCKEFGVLLENKEMTPIKRKNILLNVISMELKYRQ